MVKGVAWDPVGTFLASQSDDKSVIVWRCEDWSCVTRVTQPFTHSYGSTFSLRLGWSPDGQTLTTANSYDMDKATAQVLTRGDWKARVGREMGGLHVQSSHSLLRCSTVQPSFTFVGHIAPVVVVRFNPRLFRRPADEDNRHHDPCCVVAIGSQDKQARGGEALLSGL
jgi:protein HIRA/HIR1